MCGRYSLAPEESVEIEKLLREIQGRFKTGEIFPTNDVPVLMEAGAELAPAVMAWGYPRFGSKPGSIINARSETAGERPMFRKSLYERRCVFPTTGFYEWGPGEGGKKTKYRFNRAGDKALYLAGLWNEFKGERKCVILTRAANASVKEVHERMPVVLEREELEAWVRDTGRAVDMLRAPAPALVKEPVE